MGIFGILPITLKPEKIHVLADVLSKIAYDKEVVNEVEVPYFEFSKFIKEYDDDQFFGPSVQAGDGNWPGDTKKRVRIEGRIPSFGIKDIESLYNKKACVLQEAVSSIRQIAHDSIFGCRFKFERTIFRLGNFHSRNKARDVKKYIDGYMKRQNHKESNVK